MEKEISEKIREIIGEMQCPKDFKCAKLGFEELCNAKDIGLKSHLKCLESDSRDCRFSEYFFTEYFGAEYFCNCPLRVYIAKKLGK